MLPYIELQKQLPKGTPMKERTAAAKALKAELARGGGSSGGIGSEYHSERRSNPGGNDLFIFGGIAAFGLWLWNRSHAQHVR